MSLASTTAVHVLLNPAGGNGRAVRRWAQLEPIARRLFPDLTVHTSAARGDLAAAAARLAPLGGLLLAAGGDGTSHEIVNGLLAAGPQSVAAIGWLPLGSGNDLARGVGVPLDPTTALAAYRASAVGSIDAGLVRYRAIDGQPASRFFGNSFTLGLSADALQIVNRIGKPLGGPTSYLVATMAALARHQPLHLTLDGVAGQFRFVSVTNTPTIGAGMRITPHARPDDGRLDLMTIHGISRLQTARLLPSVYWAGHVAHPAVRFRTIQHLQADTSDPVAFEIDGELGIGTGPFTVSVLPGALRVARPNGRGLDSSP